MEPSPMLKEQGTKTAVDSFADQLRKPKQWEHLDHQPEAKQVFSGSHASSHSAHAA